MEGEDTLYTGKCSIKRENGNEITYTYLKGHLIADIETYPGGFLNEELYYDTTGLITKRVRYYRNGHISYITIFGDHAYEAFYENGSIYRKGMYGMKRGRYGYRDSDFYRNTLFDSIWIENGNFDSVYRYSQASITY
jgi:antitoxin component YwqK of YwqJK toxin-antitoxin module